MKVIVFISSFFIIATQAKALELLNCAQIAQEELEAKFPEIANANIPEEKLGVSARLLKTVIQKKCDVQNMQIVLESSKWRDGCPNSGARNRLHCLKVMVQRRGVATANEFTDLVKLSKVASQLDMKQGYSKKVSQLQWIDVVVFLIEEAPFQKLYISRYQVDPKLGGTETAHLSQLKSGERKVLRKAKQTYLQLISKEFNSLLKAKKLSSTKAGSHSWVQKTQTRLKKKIAELKYRFMVK